MPRLHGRNEDSTKENTVIVEVKLKKSEEMSRRIDLGSTTDEVDDRLQILSSKISLNI